jgi:membrane fusion protein (multidrug efflux system)
MRYHILKTLQALIIIALISVLISLTACGGSKAEQAYDPNAAVPVVTQTVQLNQVSYNDIYPGTVTALNQVDIRAQVSGYVTEIYFKDGDHVSKGQKLYTIDPQLYTANYEQAVANLNVQQAALDKAQKDADRYHELAKNDAIAKQQVDYAEAALATAIKQVEAAKSAVQAVQTNVKYTTITAPFDGTIGISQVKVGTAIVQGQTLLNTVSTTDPMAVDFSIDQKEIYRFVKLLQNSRPNDSTFSIAFSKNEVYPYHGKISLLDRAVDPQTGTLKVRLEFPDKNGILRAGMSCDVLVKNSSPYPVITIPYKAVVEQLGEYVVYTVKGDKVSQQKVVLGNQSGNGIVIKEGLQNGDVVVVDGVQKIHDGSKILTK